MLEELLREMNNWFLCEDGIHEGTYTAEENGGIALPFLQDGQYFRIVGSALNDGVYQYPAEGLAPERFTGAVWALSVPKAVITLSKEITAYNAKNGAVGPYTSENYFGKYSYTKATNAKGLAVTWRDVFAGRIAQFRRAAGNYSNAKPNPRTAPPAPLPRDFWR